MARVPIEDGFFRIPDDPAEQPRLLGSRCPACGEVFFPRRLVCAKCLHEGTEDTELSTRGRIHTWTYCHVPMFGKKDADVAGYGVAQVDLPEGPRVQSILSGGRDDFAIGMEVEIDLETLRQDKDGNDVVIYRFRPAEHAAANRSRGMSPTASSSTAWPSPASAWSASACTRTSPARSWPGTPASSPCTMPT